MCAILDDDLDSSVGEVSSFANKALDQCRGAVFLSYNQHSRKTRALIPFSHKRYLQWRFDFDVLRNPQKHT
jgi:hypothetical protein